ncbi:MAG: carbohydrate ABC transporter permease [Clostridia bacterium]|nr:carbohydrate ABC transporter permease [Clostridia bacterium]
MKRPLGENIFITVNTIVLTLLCILCLYPFFYAICVSLSNPQELAKVSGFMYKPAGFSLNAYKAVLTNRQIFTGYRNTLFIVFFGVLIELVITTMTAYVLSRKNVLWRNTLMMFIVLTMYFSGGLIPTYLIVREYGLYDSLWSLILPVAMNAYNMIIVRTYMASIHDSLSESAMIDGAGHFTILWKIFVPLCKPSLAVLVLYSGVGHWNGWFRAFIYLSSSTKYPLQLVLRNLLIQGSTLDMMNSIASGDHEFVLNTLKQASVMVSTLPILCIYPLLQKYFVGGIMIGSIKE